MFLLTLLSTQKQILEYFDILDLFENHGLCYIRKIKSISSLSVFNGPKGKTLSVQSQSLGAKNWSQESWVENYMIYNSDSQVFQ